VTTGVFCMGLACVGRYKYVGGPGTHSGQSGVGLIGRGAAVPSMQVAIIGDSHIPSREPELPEAFRERVAAADHVLHTGDFDSEGALANMRELAAELTAVSGNMDPRIGLPDTATVDLEGVTFVLTHGTGSPEGWEERVAETVLSKADEEAIGVAGHTHRVVDTVYEGVRILNPGSVTGAVPAKRASMYTATVEDGELEIELHEL
jgi:putative phosphoesterase